MTKRMIAVRRRCYLTDEQENLAKKTLGCCRYVYNHYLEICNIAYEEHRRIPSYNECCKDMTAYKKEKTYLKEADSTALQSSVRFLSDAWNSFFDGRTEKPVFHKKGKKDPCIQKTVKGMQELSETEKSRCPHPCEDQKLQKRLSAQAQYGDHQEPLVTLRVIPRRDGSMRTPPGHLMISSDVICIEDLDIKGMLEQKFLSKSIADASWGEFIRMLEYKAEWYGRTVLRSDRYSPTSQKCHVCGNINPAVKDLSIRQWECPVCHTVHNRDVTAAINIKTDALRIAGLL